MSATLFGSCEVNLKPSFVAVAGYWLDTGRYFYKSFWSKEDFYMFVTTACLIIKKKFQ